MNVTVINFSNSSGVPYARQVSDDLIKELTGKQIRGITDKQWRELDLRTEVIERISAIT